MINDQQMKQIINNRNVLKSKWKVTIKSQNPQNITDDRK